MKKAISLTTPILVFRHVLSRQIQGQSILYKEPTRCNFGSIVY